MKIIALRTEYIVRERYINAAGCLNIKSEDIIYANGRAINRRYA
jgi:hypothetical protein